jgi:hypothetical protein
MTPQGGSLGERWLPAGPAVLQRIPIGEDSSSAILEFEAACESLFYRILLGDPGEEVERLVRSSQRED